MTKPPGHGKYDDILLENLLNEKAGGHTEINIAGATPFDLETLVKGFDSIIIDAHGKDDDQEESSPEQLVEHQACGRDANGRVRGKNTCR